VVDVDQMARRQVLAPGASAHNRFAGGHPLATLHRFSALRPSVRASSASPTFPGKLELTPSLALTLAIQHLVSVFHPLFAQIAYLFRDEAFTAVELLPARLNHG
jgi:hypothetical protein